MMLKKINAREKKKNEEFKKHKKNEPFFLKHLRFYKKDLFRWSGFHGSLCFHRVNWLILYDSNPRGAIPKHGLLVRVHGFYQEYC